MANPRHEIEKHYERFYSQRTSQKVYPTEFVVRIFLARYPALRFDRPARGSRVLDVGFGDGRNTVFLCDQGFSVAGVEIAQGIVDQARERLSALGYRADLRVGRNSALPFDDGEFDCILACHSCYYCDDGETLRDNLREYARVLKPGGWLVASVANRESYIFDGAVEQPDQSLIISSDPYGNRNGYRLHAFRTTAAIESYFSPDFREFSFGAADNDFFGIVERVFWVVCRSAT